MSESLSRKSSKSKDQSHAEGRPHTTEDRPTPSGLQAGFRGLQRTVGNQAVNQLLRANTGAPAHGDSQGGRLLAASSDSSQPESTSQAEILRRAEAESGQPMDPVIRAPLEQAFGVNLGNVRVHTGPAAESAAENVVARAYTVGSNIYLGREARGVSGEERSRLLTHEAVHTVQQGGQPVALQGKMAVSQPRDIAEIEADRVAESVISGESKRMSSPALAMRNSMRVTSVGPAVQRDIKGSKKLTNGKFEINFKKNEAAAAGAMARENGTVTFTPSKTAPESDSIRFVQIVRTFDPSTGDEFDFTGTPEANRNKMRTKRDTAKNIAPGFYVDQIAASLAKRTKKADPAVLPYYDAMLANPGNKIGKRKGKTIQSAVLDDHPGSTGAIKFAFVTSAKAADTGTWYGSVLWGFQTFLNKKGIAKIKGEYKSFREFRGETTDKALNLFDEFYQNPGTPTAPTK